MATKIECHSTLVHAIFPKLKNVLEQVQVSSTIHLIPHIVWRHTLILIESSCQVIAITFAPFLLKLWMSGKCAAIIFQVLGRREVRLTVILHESSKENGRVIQYWIVISCHWCCYTTDICCSCLSVFNTKMKSFEEDPFRFCHLCSSLVRMGKKNTVRFNTLLCKENFHL